MRKLYNTAAQIGLPFVWAYLRFKYRNEADFLARRKEMAGRVDTKTPIIKPVIWVHAASVGEVIAAAPLIRKLHAATPNFQIVMTTMTPTGAREVKSRLKNIAIHQYAPLDIPRYIKRFMRSLDIKHVIIMERELWPNWLCYLSEKAIPITLANARLSLSSMQKYKKNRHFCQLIDKSMTQILTQEQIDAEHFSALGVDETKINVLGNIKFDIEINQAVGEAAELLRRELGNRQILVAGSTHKGEELILLAAFHDLKKQFPDLLLILTPRHPERFDEVFDLCGHLGFVTRRRSHGEVVKKDTDILLGDTMGELLHFYAVGDVCFVGGSMVPVGGHNLLEPAALSKPILTGHHTQNFAVICKALEHVRAMLRVSSAKSIHETLVRLFGDVETQQRMGFAAKGVVDSNKGALQRQVDAILTLL